MVLRYLRYSRWKHGGLNYEPPFYTFEKVNELLNTHLEEDDDNAETIAGFVLKHLGHFPTVSEQFRYQNFLFTVEEADERSISLLLVQNLTPRPSHGTT